MSTPRSLDGLRRSSDKSRNTARSKIKKALRDMQRKGLPINPNAVAKYADVARRTVYNHTDLLEDIKAAKTTPTPHPAPLTEPADTESSTITTALRNQLRTQKQSYETEVAELKTQIKNLKHELAAAHGEIHRLRNTCNTTTQQSQ